MSSATGRRWRRVAVIGATASVAMLAVVGSASAHVTVHPNTAVQGGDATIAFQVPNEEDAASTTELQVSFPTDHPIPSVAIQAVPGWTATVQKTTLATPVTTDDGQVTQAVSMITWTGGKIAPGQFQQFDVSLGNLPSNTTDLTFKAVQTYDNGDVVRWIDEAAPGAPEPQHPAPVLHLTPAAAAPTAASATADASGTTTAALVLAVVAVVLALIAAVLAGLALRRRIGSTGRGTV
ncbi:YcnI family protein [Pseudonocardia acidicola]|uniref:YcnI family protein n=1 Tax=Pseudonocardia acidicola TaxID=2724939 RepID=A0ABX1SI03_9PSEU|nr:YcnI family protein [Pseudonocardia acidicola]NMI01199.1 YcnI family protein [Pseudonocardia acidicola]